MKIGAFLALVFGSISPFAHAAELDSKILARLGQKSNCDQKFIIGYLGAIEEGYACLKEMGSSYAAPFEKRLAEDIDLRCKDLSGGGPGSQTLAVALPTCLTGEKPQIWFNSGARESKAEMRSVFFHETLHLVGEKGFPHFAGVEVAQSCTKCCFGAKYPAGRDAACRICKGEFESSQSTEYLQTLFKAFGHDRLNADYVASSALTALYKEKDLANRKKILAILPKMLSADTGYLAIGQSLYRVLKQNTSMVSPEVISRPEQNSPDYSWHLRFFEKHIAAADQFSYALGALIAGNPQPAREALKVEMDGGTASGFNDGNFALYHYQRDLALFLEQYEQEHPEQNAWVKHILRQDVSAWIKQHPVLNFWFTTMDVVKPGKYTCQQ